MFDHSLFTFNIFVSKSFNMIILLYRGHVFHLQNVQLILVLWMETVLQDLEFAVHIGRYSYRILNKGDAGCRNSGKFQKKFFKN